MYTYTASLHGITSELSINCSESIQPQVTWRLLIEGARAAVAKTSLWPQWRVFCVCTGRDHFCLPAWPGLASCWLPGIWDMTRLSQHSWEYPQISSLSIVYLCWEQDDVRNEEEIETLRASGNIEKFSGELHPFREWMGTWFFLWLFVRWLLVD